MVLRLLLFTSLLLLASCQSMDGPRFNSSGASLPTPVRPFTAYQQQVRDYLQTNRIAVSDDPEWEITLNAPYECGENATQTGILLVHGLGDSPYFFHDVARDLCQQGLRVRTILLPGHGSRPGNMLRAEFDSWRATTEFHIDALADDVDTLILGGFSTGANLVALSATQRDDVAGLLLFSPAFDTHFSASWVAPFLTGLYPWPNIEEENNPTRYNSMPMQGFAAYQQSVAALKDALEERALGVPVFMVVAEEDSVVDVDFVAEQFNTRFLHSNKHLIWLGETPPDIRAISNYSMDLPDQRIGAASHMSVLFSPDNPLYGQKGRLRICDNGQGEDKTRQCHNGEPVWYGPWGLTHPDRVYARLTYNPHYSQMMSRLTSFIAELN